MPSKNFQKSLFLTVVACRIKAPEFDTSSMTLPSRINSPYWTWDTEQATPGLIRILRMYFSSPKFHLNKRTILLNKKVDGEVGIHSPHLVMEAQHNTLDQVLCMTPDHVNSCQFPSVSPPFVNPEPLLFLSKETQFCIDVIEVPPQGASGALHNNCPSLLSNIDIFLEGQQSDCWEKSHSHSRCGKEQS